MPAQAFASSVPEYAVGDTAPPLRSLLCDGAGKPINLTGCTVVFNLAFASYSYYYAPMQRQLDGKTATPDPDQTEGGNRGYVDVVFDPDDLSLAGTFRFNYEVTYPNATRQTISPSVTNTFIVRAPAGGMQYA